MNKPMRRSKINYENRVIKELEEKTRLEFKISLKKAKFLVAKALDSIVVQNEISCEINYYIQSGQATIPEK